MEMTTAKTVAVFAIIIGCFTILYPKIFHPMVFGGGKQKTETAQDILNQMPSHQGQPGRGRGPDQPPHHMHRPGPHPGLRAAAEMKKASQGSSGRGMMGVILPMYAVGIVLYLIYTLTKVFTKKSESKEEHLREHYRELKFDPRKKEFTFGNMDEDESFGEKKQLGMDLFDDRHGRSGFEDLLLKADERNIGEFEMHQLRKKLEETEKQMARILHAMESVQQATSNVGDVTGIAPQLKQEGKRAPGTSMDSSPDMDTYEVINGQIKVANNQEQEYEDDFQEMSSDESEAHIEELGAYDYDANDDNEGAVRYYVGENDGNEKESKNQEQAYTTDAVKEAEAQNTYGVVDTAEEHMKNIYNATVDDTTESVEEIIKDAAMDEDAGNTNLRHRVVPDEGNKN